MKQAKELLIHTKALAKAHGLRLTRRKDGPIYANHDLSIPLAVVSPFFDNTHKNQALLLLHEVCHFLVSSDSERKDINFGFGVDTLEDGDEKIIRLRFKAVKCETSEYLRWKNEKEAIEKTASVASAYGFQESEILTMFNYEKVCKEIFSAY